MSWNILPKNVLQYFLEKLKTKFLLSKSNDILGSKNILPFPYTYGSGTVQGLTVTVHEDGSITAQGTPTQDIAFPLNANLIEDLNLSAGDELIFSEWEVQNQNAFAALLSNGTPISEIRGDYKLTITSELVQNGIAFILFFVRGVDLTTPVTFKPMIRLATDTDHTWYSPALTNKTLTDRVIYLNHDKVSKSGDTMTGNLTVNRANTGTTNVSSFLYLGNNIPEGTAGTSRGVINLYGKGSSFVQLVAEIITSNRTIYFPDKNGTMALTSDLEWKLAGPRAIDATQKKFYCFLSQVEQLEQVLRFQWLV